MELTKEQEVLQKVINEAWENESFKAELMANPVAAIEKLTGEKLNLKGKELIVRDQTDEETIFINIPAAPEVDVELNEEQLEAVAGGVHGGGCTPDPVGDKIREATDTFKGML